MAVSVGIIGECMVELSDGEAGQLKKAFSGDSFNTAVYLARCDRSNALDIQYVTALGDDALSAEMMDVMVSEGLGTGWIHRFADATPGLYLIHLDDRGERSFSYWRSQAPARRLFSQPEVHSLCDRLMGCDWLYLSGISLAILETSGRERLKGLLADFRKSGGRVCFDINYRPRLWESAEEAKAEISALYSLTDLALPSFDDEKLLFGDQTPEEVIDRLRAAGCAEVVVKDGGAPCTVLCDGEIQKVACEPVEKMADSTAAGDSFNAGYLWARLGGADALSAARAGQQVARQVIGQKGAIVPIVIPNLANGAGE